MGKLFLGGVDLAMGGMIDALFFFGKGSIWHCLELGFSYDEYGAGRFDGC
jgi:hypothetical protein